MTNSWAMLHDHLWGGSDDRPVTDDATGIFEFPNEPSEFDFPLEGITEDQMIFAGGPVPIPGASGQDTITLTSEVTTLGGVGVASTNPHNHQERINLAGLGYFSGYELESLREQSEVVITEDSSDSNCPCCDCCEKVRPASGKDATFWKYSEGKILREVEAYLSSTYSGHYVGGDNKIQTLDLIDSNGDAEAFCRANVIKYASRFGKKDGKNAKDLLKVIHYAMLLYHFAELPFTEDATETFSALGR